jgi:flavin reductase (DIM6/NTAB) family NADH-FMN oxidoreductase RutF
VLIDPSELDRRAAYRLLTSIIIPRPIAWVGSSSLEGVDNLAPFSFFNGVSTHPPVVSISVARGRGGTLKDTTRNILETGAFSVSVVDIDRIEAMHHTSGGYRGDLSEFERVGVEAVECERIRAPRVAVAPASLECTLNRAIDLDTTHLILGDVVAIHVRQELMTDGALDPKAISVVARLGGAYATLGDVRVLPPPSLPDEERR